MKRKIERQRSALKRRIADRLNHAQWARESFDAETRARRDRKVQIADTDIANLQRKLGISLEA